MEMPVPCIRCNEIVDLNDCRTSPYKDELVCRECYDQLENRKEVECKIEELELDFENDAEYLQGRKREYRKELKALKGELLALD